MDFCFFDQIVRIRYLTLIRKTLTFRRLSKMPALLSCNSMLAMEFLVVELYDGKVKMKLIDTSPTR